MRTIPVSPRSGRFGAESSLCKCFFLGAQPSGDLRDYMGGAPAVKLDANFTDAEAWANPGWATTGASSTDYFTRPAGAGHDFTLAGRALIVAMRLLKPVPVSNETVLGSYTAASAPGGLQITVNSAGSVSLAINTVANTSLSLTIGSAYTPSDGGLITWFVPPDPVSARFFKNEMPASSAPAATVAGQNCAGGNILNVGASRAGFGKAAQFAQIQIYNPDCATLAAIRCDSVAQFMHRHPMVPVPNWVWGL